MFLTPTYGASYGIIPYTPTIYGEKMGYRTGIDRDQVMMLPEVVDDYVTDDNVVRFVDVFADHLDIAELGFTHAYPEATGRPPYDPRDLLKLYLYGYMNRVRSSRSLERETKRNLEVIWLLKKLTPDFKTIADFRKDNLVPVRKVSQQFVLLCRNLDLLDRTMVGIDGSKIRAWNGKKQNFTGTRLKRVIREIDAKIAGYLEDLDRNDRDETQSEAPAGGAIREKIRRFTERKEHYEALRTMMDKTGQSQVSITDPDSRQMRTDQHTEVCFNVQATVDAKHKIIVDHEVTNEPTDIDQLGSMATRAKDVLGTETLTVLADKGYHNANEIKICVDAGITPCIPEREDRAALSRQFTYDTVRDCYICPRGSILTRGKVTWLHKRRVIPYRAKDCRDLFNPGRLYKRQAQDRIPVGTRGDPRGYEGKNEQRPCIIPDAPVALRASLRHIEADHGSGLLSP